MNIRERIALNAVTDSLRADWSKFDEARKGPSSDRSAYDENTNSAVRSYLESKGFKNSSRGNADPSKGDVFYSKSYEPDAGDAEWGETHTVVVHPNGEWEHESEGVHMGSGTTRLKTLFNSIEVQAAIIYK